MPSAHLHPMPPDGLRPRSAPQAAASSAPVLLSDAPLAPPETMLRPASFPDEENESLLGDLLLFCAEEEDEDDNEPDAVPTESMPVPACVPLFDMSLPRKCGRRRKKG